MYQKLVGILSVLKKGSVETVFGVFKLHSTVTCLLLMSFSLFVTTNTYFGDSINCMPNLKDEVPEKVLNSYCWIRATYSLPKAYNEKDPFIVPHPGLDTYVEGDEMVYHTYYQWVGLFLFVQAAFFQFPRFIWKVTEGGTTSKIIMDLYKPIGANDDGYYFGSANPNLKKLARYLDHSFGTRGCTVYIYLLCELLNFVNVIAQIYITNEFLHGEFTTYGTDVFNFTMTDQAYRTDPMIEIFPRVSKCSFTRYGVAGSVQNTASLCVLPINVFNEKIFIFLWYWYVILAILSGLQVLGRMPLFNEAFRIWCVQSIWMTDKTKRQLRQIMKGSMLTDWFSLMLMQANLSNLNFEVLVDKLSRSRTP